jgi:hypothetical protein
LKRLPAFTAFTAISAGGSICDASVLAQSAWGCVLLQACAFVRVTPAILTHRPAVRFRTSVWCPFRPCARSVRSGIGTGGTNPRHYQQQPIGRDHVPTKESPCKTPSCKPKSSLS